MSQFNLKIKPWSTRKNDGISVEIILLYTRSFAETSEFIINKHANYQTNIYILHALYLNVIHLDFQKLNLLRSLQTTPQKIG